jgi:hypothetical protein
MFLKILRTWLPNITASDFSLTVDLMLSDLLSDSGLTQR